MIVHSSPRGVSGTCLTPVLLHDTTCPFDDLDNDVLNGSKLIESKMPLVRKKLHVFKARMTIIVNDTY